MIYEMRTCHLKPRTVGEFERRFAKAYERRRRLSELAAFWHTEIGPLNQVIQVWPYADLAERERVRAAAREEGMRAPDLAELTVSVRAEIMIPLSFSPPLRPGQMGPYFEIRTYTYAAGELAIIEKTWSDVIASRVQFSPLCAAWRAELGRVNTFVHIWPYRSLDERVDARRRAEATDDWPAGKRAERQGGRDYAVVAQESMIVVPSAFSPLQ